MDEKPIIGIPERTPEMIAAEILVIKEQTKRILFMSAIEIGRKLMEAKEKIPYGQFVTWLENAVQYSERTAYNFMCIAEAYGSGLSGTAASDASIGAQAESFAKLGYTQALILLGLPAQERAEFIAGLDIENMAVRELQHAVKARNKALAEKDALQQTQDEQNKKIFQLSTELYEAKTEKNALWNEQEKVIKLQRELDTYKNESLAAQRIAKAELESKRAKGSLFMAQADARFDLIAKGFEDLFTSIRELGASNPEEFYQYLRHAHAFLEDTTRKLKRIEKAGP